MTWLSVDLPEPFGPMMACTSPLFTVSESPWRISRSSTRTCRFFTSSNAVIFFPYGLKQPNQNRKQEPRKETKRSQPGRRFPQAEHRLPPRQSADERHERSRDRNK